MDLAHWRTITVLFEKPSARKEIESGNFQPTNGYKPKFKKKNEKNEYSK